MKTPHFYAVIIGSEILNGRREDKHFSFIRDALSNRGHTLFASFIIKDDPELIRTIFSMIKNDPDAVMFSFGGIGSTPDDLTREIASRVFSDSILVPHNQFYADILARFGDEAFPNRIHMADLPKDANLLSNVINNMSGFYLENRYFFMPGFPEMSHPMILDILERFYPLGQTTYRKTLIAQTSENTLIPVMEQLHPDVDFSSLPMLNTEGPSVEISVASVDEHLSDESFDLFIAYLNEKSIPYKII
ncbi:MAG: molybdopterin-binding protein [Sulfuricurvum sp.]|jgi:molybdopterin-biosynthesis enzyme MoeA-like protein